MFIQMHYNVIQRITAINDEKTCYISLEFHDLAGKEKEKNGKITKKERRKQNKSINKLNRKIVLKLKWNEHVLPFIFHTFHKIQHTSLTIYSLGKQRGKKEQIKTFLSPFLFFFFFQRKQLNCTLYIHHHRTQTSEFSINVLITLFFKRTYKEKNTQIQSQGQMADIP